MLPEDNEDGDAREIPFGDAMTDPKEMETRIAQAQLAVLNSGTDPSTFLAMDPTKVKSRGGSGFTNNSVIVDLAGDGLADLNFVDLPGIIVNVGEGGDPNDIPLVQNMVKSYITRKSTIILLVISCHADFENQGAGLIATECDPDGERTVGVLTKPDRIETPEETKPWLDMITGKSNRLANGWYCVKQPDSKQRKKNLTWDDARALEMEFFRDTSPWSELSSKDRLKLGSHNLAYQLGNVLSTALEKRFAEIRIEIDRLLRQNMTELKQYPDPPTQKPSEYILDLLDKFYKDVMNKLVDGDADDVNGVIQSLRTYSLDFRQSIQQAAPVFMRDGTSRADGPKPEFIPADEEWLSKSDSTIGNAWTVTQVHERTRGGILRETNDFCPFAPTKWFMGRVVRAWEIDAMNLLESSFDRFEEELKRLVNDHFKLYTAGGFHDVVSGIADQLLNDCKTQTAEQIKYLSEQEMMPRTFHERAYDERMILFKTYYHETLEVDGAALTTMARTRTLYECAFRRYADAVPMAIDLHFVRLFGKRLHQSMSKGVDVNRDEDELVQLIKMADPIVQQRDALLEKGKRLRAARNRLSA
ncbi:Interferon-induced GTP-binding protein Mx [Rhizoctonia solani]|uniref:Interferon-induced GTP-binding protein Mx n=1 Tax=Rhizoctonia solani TaxID=456999 RepID=A0A0K6FXT7_9AGAM|nr:Interferon-induced GTP-binding protein Mx [Rhizoctonia solani]